MTNMVCVTDSDFLISLIKKDDSKHRAVLEISKKLVADDAVVIYPVTSIVEAATALLIRYNLPKLANALLNEYKDPDLMVVDVKQEDFINSVQYFNPNGSKQDTPFDCVILSIATKQKVSVILSFDDFYKGRGFKLPGDLL